jgi:hypothetical protein
MVKNSGHSAIELLLQYFETLGWKFAIEPTGDVQPVDPGSAYIWVIPIDNEHYVEFAYHVRIFPISENRQARLEYSKARTRYALGFPYDNMTILIAGEKHGYGVLILTEERQEAKLMWALHQYAQSILKDILGSHTDGQPYNPLRPHRIGFRYDPATQRILGGCTKQEAERAAKVMLALTNAWRQEYGNEAAPVETHGAIASPLALPVYDVIDEKTYLIPVSEAFQLPELQDTPENMRDLAIHMTRTPTACRLAEVSPQQYRELKDALQISVNSFSRNLFGIVRVAHKCLHGTFTDDTGSSLFASNVGVDGYVHDYETFHSGVVFPGDSVPGSAEEEDLRLAFEVLLEFCMLDQPEAWQGLFLRGTKIAYAQYTRRRTHGELVKGVARQDLELRAAIGVQVSPFANLAELLVQERNW